jgi:hypothetical protein
MKDDWSDDVDLEEDDDVPYAEVEQTGRFTFTIRILHGVFQWGPDGLPFTHVGTESGAEKKARRLIAKYERMKEKEDLQKLSRFRVD